ncbi:hypothetical protein LPJ66_002272 [Kickxella alabastrina]|uniref:Uncharacterized protein n=1 Tax=Kickxella alabastrina TaxID=61397 RepID=A0ACC1IR06_9FUNG|nr:hypothetical protein LPJ66_002272 [Kickxella alabastrina]
MTPTTTAHTSDIAAAAIAQSISQQAHTLHNHQTTYIPKFTAEFLQDHSNTLRALRACNNDHALAAQALAQTLAWREANKVYPNRRPNAPVLVDTRGRIIIKARQLSTNNGGRRVYARGLETLEDMRVALKLIDEKLETEGEGVCAVVCPVESLALSDIAGEDVEKLVEVAREHYPGVVGRLYVTAQSSVLLAHARQALRPLLVAYEGGVEYVLASKLAESLCSLENYTSRLILPPAVTNATAPGGAVLGHYPRTLADYVGQVPSTAAMTEDDFCSAYSDARDTQCHTMEPPPTRPQSRMGLFGRNFNLSMTPKQQQQQQQPLDTTLMNTRDFGWPSGLRAGDNNESSNGGSSNGGSRMTSVQLASLQRAVQSVQRMLGSINDSISAADSRSALAATKSRLVQQADVLMSTVAALNFGVSMTGSITDPTKLPGHFSNDKSSHVSLLCKLGLQLLALPMSILFGRSSNSILATVRHLVLRTVKLIVRRLKMLPAASTLMLLAYKHLRVYTIVFWTGALLLWQANAAIIWSNLMLQWRRGLSF